ncbi:5-carboxymethyl-2-hydroxymuconate Delta-isomerase [Sneathiella chinensis]|uniref:5-carboxymethyl-2-hydroxymuconate isomerase n=1 Tax=Sneathiella chinensis TaxID=349750 RepID=A0ABQ5U2K5_9PROT|nr:5-carboxymethyl-2-hydroxymuconate Delta-isomerase [Sneathiella chinensis]GLQ05911.1 hypothetical protein GCM10007924_11320 [Sneathiella chinensis]
MPHFVLEYSREIEASADVTAIMETVFTAACESGVMNPDDIKVRAIPYDHFRLRKAGETFLHITASLLEGRTDEQKEKVSVLVRSHLDSLLPDVTSISIDVRDMNAVAYKKRLLPE